MNKLNYKHLIFLLFFVSGFCALLYQTIWLRLAFAAFGINAQVLSIVISVFMLGLLIGSLLTGTVILKAVRKRQFESLYIYGMAEAGVGIGALVVPKLFSLGHNWLLSLGQTSSLGYLSLSALVLAVAILPWCVLMGMTIPLIMDFVNRRDQENKAIFSFLYLANTFGAMIGTLLTAVVFVELFGFTHTLIIGAILNFCIAGISISLAKMSRADKGTVEQMSAVGFKNFSRDQWYILTLLFVTGFSSLGVEVVWNRLFTPVLSTSVYAFAFTLFIYLLGTCAGLFHYRYDLKRSKVIPTAFLLLVLVGLFILQIWFNDPRFGSSIVGVLLTVLSISYVLGYLTPKQVDQISAGNARVASMAYAVNILGCILGPLIVSYLFLPLIGSKIAIGLLTLPLAFLLLKPEATKTPLSFEHKPVLVVALLALIFSVVLGQTLEENYSADSKQVRYDYNATVVAFQTDKTDPRSMGLIVNGIPMTVLEPVTKIMAHLPLSLEGSSAKKALVICLGMGTTFRSALSWGIDVTAVELTPSVAKSFPFFFPDGSSIVKEPNAHIVVDDGRRYLERVNTKYDLIAIDPPPPIVAAGSSLLYSQQFYEVAKDRLTPNGILAQWYPGTDDLTAQAVARSISDEFPYVKVYKSIEPWGGYHFFASNSPVADMTPQEMVDRMPQSAQKDLMEWNDFNDPNILAYAKRILGNEISINEFLNSNKNIEVTDDQPYNEYYWLRSVTKTTK